MSIIKIKKYDIPFVMLDKRPLNNPELSWKAKGILAYLLSHPDNWTINIGDLIARSTDGEDAVRSGIRELIKAGHIKYTGRERNNGQVGGVLYEVYEIPILTSTPIYGGMDEPDMENRHQDEKPNPDFPNQGFPNQEKQDVNNNELNNKERAQLSKEKQLAGTQKALDNFYKRQASGEVDFSWLGEGLDHFARAFVRACGSEYAPLKRERSFWRKVLLMWQEIGFTDDIIERTVQKMKTQGLNIAGPQSITNMARSMMSSPGQSNFPPEFHASAEFIERNKAIYNK
jgi:hypothetical protein